MGDREGESWPGLPDATKAQGPHGLEKGSVGPEWIYREKKQQEQRFPYTILCNLLHNFLKKTLFASCSQEGKGGWARLCWLPPATQLLLVELGFDSRLTCSKAHSLCRIRPSPSERREGKENELCLFYKYAVIIVQRQLLWSLKAMVRFRKHEPLSSPWVKKSS